MTIKQIVREFFPSSTDEEIEFILWEKTGYPSFWIESDGDTPEACLRTQLKRFKDEVEGKQI